MSAPISRYIYQDTDYLMRCWDQKFHFSLKWVIDNKGKGRDRYIPLEYYPCNCDIKSNEFKQAGELKKFLDSCET